MREEREWSRWEGDRRKRDDGRELTNREFIQDEPHQEEQETLNSNSKEIELAPQTPIIWGEARGRLGFRVWGLGFRVL